MDPDVVSVVLLTIKPALIPSSPAACQSFPRRTGQRHPNNALHSFMQPGVRASVLPAGQIKLLVLPHSIVRWFELYFC
jgi:hypothetical protein